MAFKYAEWNYELTISRSKYGLKINRFERYNSLTSIHNYCEVTSRIKLALDSHCGNKLYRQIIYAEVINS